MPSRLEEVARELNNVLFKIGGNVNANNVMYQQIHDNTFSQETEDDGMSAEVENPSYYVPDMPNFVVGFVNFITHLKKLLFQSDVNAIGVTGMSGRGKSTLAQGFYNDDQGSPNPTLQIPSSYSNNDGWGIGRVVRKPPFCKVMQSIDLAVNSVEGTHA
eukprot:Gb_30182 [translate_table: standard]